MKKILLALILLVTCSQIFAVNAALITAPAAAAANSANIYREEQLHNRNYHQSIIEGTWMDKGCSVERVFTHKDENNQKHYVYSVIRHYQRLDYYSCREHVYREYLHNEYERPATNDEITEWEKRKTASTIFLIGIISITICCIIVVIILGSK